MEDWKDALRYATDVFMGSPSQRHRQKPGTLKLFRMWTEGGVAEPGQFVSRMPLERLRNSEAFPKVHAPLSCLFFGFQELTGAFYQVILEPGDPAAYAVPVQEWEAWFSLVSDQPFGTLQEWYSRANRRFVSVLIDEDMEADLKDVPLMMAPAVEGSYMIYAEFMGLRVVCPNCAQAYCNVTN